MTDFAALIKELKQTKEGSRELSDKVLLASGWIGQSESSRMAGILIPHWKSPSGDDVPTDSRPCPTTSLDAALTLVPEGYLWAVGVHTELGNHFAVCQHSVLTQEGFDGAVDCPTPALALCIAAFKAREHG